MRFIPLLALLVITTNGSAQVLRRVCSFPSLLNEISGMVLLGDKIIAMPDGGNFPYLYVTDTGGTILHQIFIEGGNEDWEELTLSGDSILFIGDIGNNTNSRKNLSILKIRFDKSKLLQNLYDTLYAERIEFSYANQTAFPPTDSELNFDAEAMICYRDSLWTFTKNRTAPYTGWTYVYRMPASPGKYSVHPIDSFQNVTTLKELSWITGACLTQSGDLVLLSSDHALRFNQLHIREQPQRFSFSHISQKESVFYGFGDQLWISDEKSPFQAAGLYAFNLSVLGGLNTKVTQDAWYLYNDKSLTLNISGHLRIIGMRGELILEQYLEAGQSVRMESTNGPVILELQKDGRIFRSPFIKFNSIP